VLHKAGVVLLDTNQVFLIVLLIVFAVVIFFELRFMRSRNKDHIQRVIDRDEVYNSLMTTKAIASSLRQRGRDTKEADQILSMAEDSYRRNNLSSVRVMTLKARDILMKAPASALESTPPAESVERAEPQAPEEEHKSVHEVKQLEPNMLESRFLINSCRGRLEECSRSGKEIPEAEEHLCKAEKFFEEKKYDEALREGLKTRKLLGEGGIEATEPVIVKVPKPELTCAKCSAKVANDDAFCRKCGAPIVLKRSCAYCRAELEDGDAFCPKCGRKA
jgi:hypothetical protein